MYSHLMRLMQLPRLALQTQPRRVICATEPRSKQDICALADKVKFEFTEENKCRVKELLTYYPESERRGALLPLLDVAQRQHGWLPITAIQTVAEILKIEPFAVWQVATFYTMFQLRPIGKYLVKVCMTTPCQLSGCTEIWDTCKKTLELKHGETSEDMNFTLRATYCMGACVNAPVMSVNDDIYEDLNPEEVEQILCSLKNDIVPPSGPRSGRFASEPLPGPTTLLMEPPPAGYGMQELCKPKTKPC